MGAKWSSLNVFCKCSILTISECFHTEGSAKEVHRVAAWAWAWWILIMLNKIDSDQSIWHHWNCANEQQNAISCWRKAKIQICKSNQTLPISSSLSFSSQFLVRVFLPLQKLLDASQNQAPDVWKTSADKVINPFGGQMLSENVPCYSTGVSKCIRNIN